MELRARGIAIPTIIARMVTVRMSSISVNPWPLGFLNCIFVLGYRNSCFGCLPHENILLRVSEAEVGYAYGRIPLFGGASEHQSDERSGVGERWRSWRTFDRNT